MKPLSIYVHIPFCQVKCPYCDFFSVANSDSLIGQYFAILQDEISFFAERAGTGYRAKTIFFGGGTPSYVPAKLIATTLRRLQNLFCIEKDAEITLEMNPGSCEMAKLADYRAMGINRISLGIQSFQDSELHFLGRVHSAKEGRSAVESVQHAGFENFNLDLIFAIPGQTMQTWMKTLETALSYKPPHVSAYNLTYEEGTPLAGQKSSGAIQPLSEASELAMFKKNIARLHRAGLEQYEISNFARPGKEARHNLAYWMGQDYLGFGVGAHSYFEGRRFSKKRSLQHYLSTTSLNSVDLTYDEDLKPERRFWELMAIGLRNLNGVHPPTVAIQSGIPWKDSLAGRWDPWIEQGFLRTQAGVLNLTQKGLYYYDRIASSLIEAPGHH